MDTKEIYRLAEENGLPRRAVYSVRALSRLLGIGKQTLYDACHSGRIHHIRVGRQIYVPVSEAARILSGEVKLRGADKGGS